MDKLKNYRQLIKKILSEYSQVSSKNNPLETQTIFDEIGNHYQVVTLGWEGEKYVHYCLIHLDLKSDKIWIQWNMTEQEIAEDLVKLGVPKHDIVIGFHPPQLRSLTNYAVG